jgi:hypothetical protein
MQSGIISNDRLLKAIQSFKINPKREGFISEEEIYCTLSVNETKPYNYTGLRITQPGYKDMLIVDGGDRCHYLMQYPDGHLVPVSKGIFSAVFAE